MKAFILVDEINQFHWTVLKSVILILSILPLSQGLLYLWLSSEGSSQIMVGFFALSLMSALCILSFYSALKMTVMTLKDTSATVFEQSVLQLYKYLPMLVFAGIVIYISMFLTK
ncbi:MULTISPECIES: hypothetical protein [unclassified Acinetobacter]|uniref:hypothetical protein n=1 Tax=unclassified Acinetobacter TaxID=196816 RepID=UPI002935062F|nr:MULTISPECIES: hypothetical protein [unclassified Acinetobacter]WOE32578.1 hypothetical protein QSG84_05150 [Acinetobacter sp. SAAs470]WOE38053.1 hypothetical protein QSG86_14205 [Acinetobacter sp. SAAs474]